MAGILDGKVALVTGGGRGIGSAIVQLFKDEGAKIMTCGRGPRPADLSPNIGWETTDVADPSACQKLVDQTVKTFGTLDILVNNAGVQVEKTVAETTDQDWDLLMGVNARGVFSMSRASISVMAAQGGGAIINIGSISGHVSDPSMALYNASKAFVHGLTRSIAVDHGPEGIRCNAICPGWIMTEMADAAFDLAKDPERAKEDSLARHALRRFGQPEDIAKAALWLASPQSEFVTGQTITVDGGLTVASPLNPSLF